MRPIHRLLLAPLLLLSVPLIGCSAARSEAAAHPADGQALFRDACATCHLSRGALIGVEPLPLLLSEPLRRGDAEPVLRAVIRSGVAGTTMPGFADVLTDAEIDALVAYIRARRAASRTSE